MKNMNRWILGGLSIIFCSMMNAQIIDRERPKEWEQLVIGGRYMDRFQAMPDGKLSDKVWGAKEVLPRYVDNGIESSTHSFWGGNILKGEDGLYHLFVCGWPENSPQGHMFWSQSTVFHTVSEKLHGPYRIIDEIGKGHNPEAYFLSDGRIVIYVIDGYYLGENMDGPWTYHQFQFDNRERSIIEGLSNLTFATRQDGSKLMICRGGGVWISEDGLAPYRQLTDKRVYPDVDGRFEDPVVWRDDIQYHLIVNDWYGRIAYYQRSKDGVHWITEAGEAYVPGVSFHKNGYVEEWFKYERAKVFQDEYGRVTQMNFAVIDTIKWDDLPNDRHSSKNICLPMNKGLLLSVLNKKAINEKTNEIKVLIKSEEGLNPHEDIDIASLRFGTHVEVNFGRGAKVLRTKKMGKDLLVIFAGQESGITEEEFAPKLIGKDKKGEMIYGYAKLPYVDYTPPILSALKPRYKNGELGVEVQNFGLTSSKQCHIKVYVDGLLVANGKLGKLKPNEKIVCILSLNNATNWSEKGKIEVVFESKGKELDRNRF